MLIMSESSVQILSSLLDKATNYPANGLEETVDALNKACALLRTNSLSLKDLVLRSLSEPMSIPEDLEEAKKYITALEGKLSLFQNPKLESRKGFHSFDQLRDLVVRMNAGVLHGWQTALNEASKTATCGEISLALIQKWRQMETIHNRTFVPVRYFEAIPKMIFPRTSVEKVRYSEADYLAIVMAYDKYQEDPDLLTYVEIANNLSDQLQRRLTENSVKSEFHRIKLTRFAVTHLTKMKSENSLSGKSENELAMIISNLIGRAVSKKIIQKAMLLI